MKNSFLEKVEELKEILLQMQRAYPNGYQSLFWEAKRLFDELTDMPYDEDNN